MVRFKIILYLELNLDQIFSPYARIWLVYRLSKSHRSRELETIVVVANYDDVRTTTYVLRDGLRIVVETSDGGAAYSFSI